MEEIKVLILLKGEEKYVFVYDSSTRADVLKAIQRYADHEDLNFTQKDADFLIDQVKKKDAEQDVDRSEIGYPDKFYWSRGGMDSV